MKGDEKIVPLCLLERPHISTYSLLSPRFEAELAIRQSVESDISGLRKVIDDTNMSRLQLESEIETLKEELIFMKKNHQDVRLCWPWAKRDDIGKNNSWVGRKSLPAIDGFEAHCAQCQWP